MIRLDVGDALPLDAPDGAYYEVRIYPNRSAYLRAVRRRNRLVGDNSSGRDLQATTFHERRVNVMTGEVHPCAGAIYVHQDMLDGEILTHESLHAALDLYRRRHRHIANFGRNETDAEVRREEELALSTGRMAQAIADELWQRGVWTRANARKVA
jgi:hypothetical protein